MTVTNAKEMVEFFSQKYNKEGNLHTLQHSTRTVLLVNDVRSSSIVQVLFCFCRVTLACLVFSLLHFFSLGSDFFFFLFIVFIRFVIVFG